MGRSKDCQLVVGQDFMGLEVGVDTKEGTQNDFQGTAGKGWRIASPQDLA